ncbi:MAG: Rieske (2Fe-2S) protein [Chitinophagaceae bacterium]
MERKDFLVKAGALCGLALIPGFIVSCNKDTTVLTPSANFTVDLNIPANASLNTVGGSLIINSILIIHTAAGFTALQATCTHQGCTVGYNTSGNNIICPCHNGVFDISGNVTSGPPPSALHKYTVTQSGSILTIV